MNQYDQMAVELIAKAGKYDQSQVIYRELMAAAGSFAIAGAIAGSTEVLASFASMIGDAINDEARRT